MKETFQSARSRQHRGRQSISKSTFFANRVDGAVVGQPGRARSAQDVQSGQARAPRAPRSSHSRPDRTSQGEPVAQVSLQRFGKFGPVAQVSLQRFGKFGAVAQVSLQRFGKLRRVWQVAARMPDPQAASSFFVIDLANYSEVPLTW